MNGVLIRENGTSVFCDLCNGPEKGDKEQHYFCTDNKEESQTLLLALREKFNTIKNATFKEYVAIGEKVYYKFLKIEVCK